MSDWPTVQLGDVASIQQGRYLAKDEMAESRSETAAVPVHGANGIIGWTDSPMYEHGVALVTCRGSNSGMVLWADGPLWVSNNAMAIVPKEDDVRFLYYLLACSPPYSVVTGSAQPQITRRDLAPYGVIWPPPGARRATGSLLASLDDKIEQNRRMNETLEAMARAIFRDWFVDFGPTRAKMAGAAPYLAADLWALFPDRFDDGGKPEGWSCTRIDEAMELAYGKSLPAAQRSPGQVPVYGSGGLAGWHNEPLVNEPTIIVGRKGTVGSVYWEPRPCYPIDTVFFVRSELPLVFCYHLLQTLGLETMNTDAAVPGLNRGNVYRLTFTASPELIQAFQKMVEPLRARIDANLGELDTLAQIRDLLLPKLMSGEIRLKDADRILEDAA